MDIRESLKIEYKIWLLDDNFHYILEIIMPFTNQSVQYGPIPQMLVYDYLEEILLLYEKVINRTIKDIFGET